MKYIKDDLNYIFIRAQTPDGYWGDFSLNQITDKQFLDWAKEKFDVEIFDGTGPANRPLTPVFKVNLLNTISKQIGKPCVTILKRSIRKDKKKDEKIKEYLDRARRLLKSMGDDWLYVSKVKTVSDLKSKPIYALRNEDVLEIAKMIQRMEK